MELELSYYLIPFQSYGLFSDIRPPVNTIKGY